MTENERVAAEYGDMVWRICVQRFSTEVMLSAQEPESYAITADEITVRVMMLSAGSRFCYVESDYDTGEAYSIHVSPTAGGERLPITVFRNYPEAFHRIRRLEPSNLPYGEPVVHVLLPSLTKIGNR